MRSTHSRAWPALIVAGLLLPTGAAAQETPATPAPGAAPAAEPAAGPAAESAAESANEPGAGPAQDGGAKAPPAAPAAPATPVVDPQAASQAANQAASQARTTVEAGEGDVAVLAAAASKLLAAGDLDSLRTVLAGERRAAVLGLLRALTIQPPASVEPLLNDVLDLATRAAVDEVAVAADALLALLAASRPQSVEVLLAELRQDGLGDARRAAILRALGRSATLGVAGVLIEALEGPQAPVARAALKSLTGHDLGASASAFEWRAFFERNAGVSRDRLLEQAFAAERAQFALEKDKLMTEVIAVRLAAMGADDAGRLTAGLKDEYPAVRIEAARRLGQFVKSQEQAAVVVPALLRQLGYAASAEGGSPAPVGSTDAPLAPEPDMRVRVALIETLGIIGRLREDVRLALQTELRDSSDLVAAAAAAGLCQVRDQPGVVVPLLDYLDGRPTAENAEAVLLAVAINQPTGVLARLQPWLALQQPEKVRAAAVRAVVACDAIEAALDLLARLDAEGDTQKVRWNMAVALGDRLRALPPDQPAHQHAVALLERLLDGVEPTVRAEAVSALGRAGTREVLPLLERRASVETDIGVTKRIIEALGTLQLPEGGGLIGRILARSKETQSTLEPEAREALAAIARDRGPEAWLLLGEAVSGAGAHTLAVACYRELIQEYEDQAEHKDAVQRARGRLANDLYLAGRAEEALKALAELEESNAPYPSKIERLELMARASESLDRYGEAAEYHLQRYALLPEGEAQRTATLKSAVTALSLAGRHTEALGHLRELAAADPENNQLLYQMAREEEATGQLDQAEVNLQRLLQRIPSDDTAFMGEVKAALTRVRDKAQGLLPLQDGKAG